jgi:hypothetical protein
MPKNSECTPFWELSIEEQDKIAAYLAEDEARCPYPAHWRPNGDQKGDTIRCKKCGQLRLSQTGGSGWCRRCRYTFDEYFGFTKEDISYEL